MDINEIGGTVATVTQKNTGGKKQNLEGAVRVYALAKSTFTFATLAAAKLKTNWDTAKAAKDIVVFFDVEELEPNDTEAIIKNGRYRDYDIKPSVKGVNYTHYLGTFAHAAMKTFENSDYTRIFRISDNNELFCEVNDNGTIQGEPLTSMIVGERADAPADGTPSTKVGYKFDAYNLSIIIPGFDLTDYEGIHDVRLTQDSASSTSIKVKVDTIDGDSVTNMIAADFVVKDAGGSVQSVSFVAADSNGVYELTGTGFATGFTVEINGVVEQALIMYEGEAALTLTVS